MKIFAAIAIAQASLVLGCAASSGSSDPEVSDKTAESLSLDPLASARPGRDDRGDLIVTATNAANNALLVYGQDGSLRQTALTYGAGGVKGNAGGVTSHGNIVAVVNFGTQSVTLFARRGGLLDYLQVVPASSPPVSVALDDDHLYVLGTTTVESHRRHGDGAIVEPDGVTKLARADGSAAQVGILEDQLIITEKSGIVELVDLLGGRVTKSVSTVAIAPKDSDTPLGLVTHDRNGYVTLAHSDEIGLVRDGALRSLVAVGSGFPTGPGQQAPCWITLAGSFLYTANTPSHSISRLSADRRSLSVDEPIAATTTGAPTDIASDGSLLAVLEGNPDGTSRVTRFSISSRGALKAMGSSDMAGGANGLAIVGSD